MLFKRPNPGSIYAGVQCFKPWRAVVWRLIGWRCIKSIMSSSATWSLLFMLFWWHGYLFYPSIWNIYSDSMFVLTFPRQDPPQEQHLWINQEIEYWLTLFSSTRLVFPRPTPLQRTIHVPLWQVAKAKHAAMVWWPVMPTPSSVVCYCRCGTLGIPIVKLFLWRWRDPAMVCRIARGTTQQGGVRRVLLDALSLSPEAHAHIQTNKCSTNSYYPWYVGCHAWPPKRTYVTMILRNIISWCVKRLYRIVSVRMASPGSFCSILL